ncbi:MAG: hypothetical protein A4S09_11475 [Proteobacteria bacterium SG_bin7]|nr:MAG: hypothetical protein A4S09_11475 [Proteobacteria bacterium SG_bin7]
METQASWKESLEKLIQGNMRFRMGLRSVESFASALRLKELAEKGQSPSAIILTCSDSRVPTEILFDKGVGDLFVIRVAGNVISDTTIASIEYAAMILNTPLCVVMGHTQCGAIQAALNVVRAPNTMATKSIDNLLKKIVPGLKQIVDRASTNDDHTLLQHCVVHNVKAQVGSILEVSGMLRDRADQGKFRIVGAIYNLHDGAVDFDTKDIPDLKIENPLQMPVFKEFK